MPILEFRTKGLYCPQADVYIDPWRPVQRALITHGHADHSRWGHEHYLCTHAAKPVIQYRLGQAINIQSVAFGESLVINGVKFSFHPAGHIIGSAQIRMEYKGEVCVVSGDYKTQEDGLTEAFEVVKCHTFVTESTFGLPIYQWEEQAKVARDINEWWLKNKQEGKVSLIGGYALGKAQRILVCLDPSIGQIFTHGAVENVNEVLRHQGVRLPKTTRVTMQQKKADFTGSIVIATPSALQTTWGRKFGEVSTAIASGWMSLRGARRRRSVDRGFVLSDHADWQGLNEVILATGAEQVFVTHGYTNIFKKWLNGQGISAEEVKTEYEGELSEINESTLEEVEQE